MMLAFCVLFVTHSKPISELFFICVSYVKVLKNMKLFFFKCLTDVFIYPAGSPHKPFECKASVQADLVLLVDGSWSIGRTNFKKVREFLEGLVTPFHIGPYGVQIGKPGQASLCSFPVCVVIAILVHGAFVYSITFAFKCCYYVVWLCMYSRVDKPRLTTKNCSYLIIY